MSLMVNNFYLNLEYFIYSEAVDLLTKSWLFFWKIILQFCLKLVTSKPSALYAIIA